MRCLLLLLMLFPLSLRAAPAEPVGALHLMTYQSWGYTVDATPQGQRMKRILTEAVRLGFKEVVFNFRGHMITGTSAEIRDSVPDSEKPAQATLLLSTVKHAKSLGLRVAFRPILLVIGPRGEFPYSVKGKTWWHGNIQPKDPEAWFRAFFAFHRRYLELAREAGVEWYSIGAEMNSMTSGYGDKRRDWPRGFPGKWVELIGQARAILGPGIRISYGVNYTDQIAVEGGRRIQGGEIEQWRYYLTEEFRNPVDVQHQKDMQALWLALDSIGIDFYRALASARSSYPKELGALSELLTERARSHATQLDTTLTEISLSLGVDKPVYFQEVGYRAMDRGFLKPASYEDHKAPYNALHQAAAWDGFLNAFWAPRWPWFEGVAYWQVLVDRDTDGATDSGFSPFGRSVVEGVLQKHFLGR